MFMSFRSNAPSRECQSLHATQVAYGPDGSPSKALQGFCKKNGVSVDSVTTEADTKGTQYVWAVVKQPGRSASEVCTAICNYETVSYGTVSLHT